MQQTLTAAIELLTVAAFLIMLLPPTTENNLTMRTPLTEIRARWPQPGALDCGPAFGSKTLLIEDYTVIELTGNCEPDLAAIELEADIDRIYSSTTVAQLKRYLVNTCKLTGLSGKRKSELFDLALEYLSPDQLAIALEAG